MNNGCALIIKEGAVQAFIFIILYNIYIYIYTYDLTFPPKYTSLFLSRWINRSSKTKPLPIPIEYIKTSIHNNQNIYKFKKSMAKINWDTI